MSESNKQLTREACLSIRPGGGTSILSGLRSVLEMLEGRRTSNPLAAVFLLTDGVDEHFLREKKVSSVGGPLGPYTQNTDTDTDDGWCVGQDVVNRIRSLGASLFVFGYGDDCDSEHLQVNMCA